MGTKINEGLHYKETCVPSCAEHDICAFGRSEVVQPIQVDRLVTYPLFLIHLRPWMHAISVAPTGVESHLANNSTYKKAFNLTENIQLTAKIIEIDFKTSQNGENHSV